MFYDVTIVPHETPASDAVRDVLPEGYAAFAAKKKEALEQWIEQKWDVLTEDERWVATEIRERLGWGVADMMMLDLFSWLVRLVEEDGR